MVNYKIKESKIRKICDAEAERLIPMMDTEVTYSYRDSYIIFPKTNKKHLWNKNIKLYLGRDIFIERYTPVPTKHARKIVDTNIEAILELDSSTLEIKIRRMIPHMGWGQSNPKFSWDNIIWKYACGWGKYNHLIEKKETETPSEKFKELQNYLKQFQERQKAIEAAKAAEEAKKEAEKEAKKEVKEEPKKEGVKEAAGKEEKKEAVKKEEVPKKEEKKEAKKK